LRKLSVPFYIHIKREFGLTNRNVGSSAVPFFAAAVVIAAVSLAAANFISANLATVSSDVFRYLKKFRVELLLYISYMFCDILKSCNHASSMCNFII